LIYNKRIIPPVILKQQLISDFQASANNREKENIKDKCHSPNGR